MERKTKWACGSMTVFFTLIFMIIFALVGTTIELARFKVCQTHAYRTLKMAEEGLFTEYNRPLFDEYKLFLLEEEGKPFETSVMEYASPTLTADPKGMYIDMFDGAMTDVEVQKVTYAGDDGAAPLKKEIIDYMTRRVPKDIFNHFIDKKEKFENVEKEAEKIEEKVKIEKKAAESDINVLELMSLIDGVKAGGGEVRGEKIFVKMFLTGERKAQAFGINHPLAWETIKENTISIKKLINGLPKSKKNFLVQTRDCLKVTKEALETANGKPEKRSDHQSSKEVMKVLNGNKKVLEDTITLLERGKDDMLKEELNTIWKAYDTKSITFDYTGLAEKGGAENPRENLADVLKTGVLKLVLEKPDKISGKMIDKWDTFCLLYGEDHGHNERDYESKVSNFAKDEETSWNNLLGDMTGYVYDEFCLDQYIDLFCANVTEKKGEMEKALEYECEYILSGKKTDRENLESVANRLVLVRTVMNFGALLSSGKHRDTAYAAAAAIVGFTGMEPLIRLTQTILMLVWAMTEGFVDTAALYQGKKIPVIKSGNDLTVSFPELFRISHSMIQEKAKQVKEKGISMGYNEYLTIFMILMNRSVKLYRMMDLIQWNMAKNYNKNFRLASMVYSLQLKGDFQFRTKFFRLPVLESMLKRELYQFYASPEAVNTY